MSETTATVLTPDEAAELRAYEPDLLAGLLEDATASEPVKIEIRRKGRVIGAFRVRPLHENDVEAAKRTATTYKKSAQLGIKLPEDTDSPMYRSLLIYQATIPEDRKALWDDKGAWRKLEVMDGPGLIDKLLYAGEKEAIIRKLDQLSGFGDLEQTAGN